MNQFLPGTIKAVLTVAVLAGITHLLHRQWLKPPEESTTPQVVQPEKTPAPVIIPKPTPPVTIPEPTIPKPVTATPVPKRPSGPPPPTPEEQTERGRAELMALTEKHDAAGLRAFVERNANNRNMVDWVYVAKERIPLFEHEQETETLNRIPAKLRDAFARRDINAVRALIPDMTSSESTAISQMFEKCRSVDLQWGRGGAYLARGKSVAEINQELEVRVTTTDGEALRARRDWVKIDLEKSGSDWVIRKARWHRSSNRGNFTAFDMPELP